MQTQSELFQFICTDSETKVRQAVIDIFCENNCTNIKSDKTRIYVSPDGLTIFTPIQLTPCYLLPRLRTQYAQL
jgi:hypothetical protein